jgi:hypothetical protein
MFYLISDLVLRFLFLSRQIFRKNKNFHLFHLFCSHRYHTTNRIVLSISSYPINNAQVYKPFLTEMLRYTKTLTDMAQFCYSIFCNRFVSCNTLPILMFAICHIFYLRRICQICLLSSDFLQSVTIVLEMLCKNSIY